MKQHRIGSGFDITVALSITALSDECLGILFGTRLKEDKKMFRCNECASEFDKPMTIEEPMGEAWGRPVTEEINVCPTCKSSDYEVKDQVRKIERLMDDGTWEEASFEDLEKGDVCRMYEPYTNEPVVSDAGLTLMKVTSMLTGRLANKTITEPMITFDWLKEIPACTVGKGEIKITQEDSNDTSHLIPDLSRVHVVKLLDGNGAEIASVDMCIKDSLTFVMSTTAVGCDSTRTSARGTPDQMLFCASSIIEAVGEATHTKASNLASQIATGFIRKELKIEMEKANGKQ